MGLYKKWCDATKEKDKRRRYWIYVEKDGGRDEIRDGLAETIRSHYDLSPAGSGGNVVVTVPKDEGVFEDVREPAPGVICTSPVQTYLDLSVAGERGAEAAEHLRETLLSW